MIFRRRVIEAALAALRPKRCLVMVRRLADVMLEFRPSLAEPDFRPVRWTMADDRGASLSVCVWDACEGYLFSS